MGAQRSAGGRSWRARLVVCVALATLAGVGAACDDGPDGAVVPKPEPARPEALIPEVLARYPHDPGAYTQGLELEDGNLYESTGRHGQSSLRLVDLATGAVLRQADLPQRFFGEGIAVVGDRIVQLTWRERTALVYDIDTFEEVGSFAYDGEGWGLCFDGDDLIMSDGTDRLFKRDPETFEVRSVLRVHREGQPQANLNELECVGGRVWANVYLTDLIVEIDPATGDVVSTVDGSGLLAPDEGRAGVLNGIAYDEDEEVFLLTGKHWPAVFAVRFAPA